MPEVNPDILRWARETAALTLDEAARKIKLGDARGVSGPDRLAGLEAGTAAPSRSLLKRMSKQYRRPLITFYLSKRPTRGDRGQDFRALTQDHSETADALLDALLRDIMARQSMVRSVLVDEDEAEPIDFVGCMSMSSGVPAVIATIENALSFTLESFRACRNPDDAFAALRRAAEVAGVFVLLVGDLGSHHTALDVETFRGFAMADRIAPFIVINDRDSRAAWSFTLFHELAHLCLGQTGVSGSFARRRIELFCNDVAGSFFLPANDLNQLTIPEGTEFSELISLVSGFAEKRNVSSSMVAYRLQRAGRIDNPTCSRLIATCRARWHESRSIARDRRNHTEGGPNYYVVRGHRIGRALTALVRRMLGSGALPTGRAAKILGVNAKQVQPLLQATMANSATP